MKEAPPPIDGTNSDDELLESAIPPHLRVPRTLPLGAPAGFTPMHASYSARFHPEIAAFTIAYYGVQYPAPGAAAEQALARIRSALAAVDGPLFCDTASHVDDLGFSNTVFAAYWTDQDTHQQWEERLSVDWWYRSLDPAGNVGAFREIYRPTIRDSETTFSHRHPEGLAMVAKAMSGKTDTHEYWGSARDRIPRAQIDELAPSGFPVATSLDAGQDSIGRLVVVAPHENLCLLRSGQDWSETEGEEREFYLNQVKPLLDAGMDELCRDGAGFGCHFNRYLQLQDGGEVEKTYSLSAWHSLGALEVWVRADTHLAIWGAGLKHYKRAGEAARLRLYHEMTVVKAEDQSFSYFNCHRRTGMLNAVLGGGSSATG